TLPICGPPPWTTTGFMPTSFISTTSRAKPLFRASSIIALPPYLMTMVLPAKRRMYGSASVRTRAMFIALFLFSVIGAALISWCDGPGGRGALQDLLLPRTVLYPPSERQRQSRFDRAQRLPER